MCGIVGYVGKRCATEILLNGLEKLEYRGYDSAGIAVFDERNVVVEKRQGRLSNLAEVLSGNPITGNLGIGHTRWATHGAPSTKNSHPHTSPNGKFAVVHNGIIENFEELKWFLQKAGYVFSSETDTEVIPHLIDYCYSNNGADLFLAVREAVSKLEGSFALGILCADHPDRIIAIRKDSPLIVGLGNDENFIASDIPAILSETRNVYLLSDLELAVITAADVKLFDLDGNPVQKEVFKVTFSENAAQRGGYEHFMLKEIHEQPQAVSDTLRGRLDSNLNLQFDDLNPETVNKIKKIHVVACGSAYHAGLVGKTVIERLAQIPVSIDLASEFRYNSPLIDADTLVVAVSQSGETADTLASLRMAKQQNIPVLAITNVVGSTVSREADYVFYTYAGPEISVASTKAYTTQLAAFYLLALYLAETKKAADKELLDTVKTELLKAPQILEAALCTEEKIKALSKKVFTHKDMYYLGRGLDVPAAMEGSLKLKEISYIHSEAFAGGELKHGPIALIEDGTIVVALSSSPALCGKMASNVKEVLSRGAFVIALCNKATQTAHSDCSEIILVPQTHPLLAPFGVVAPLQIFAYYIAKEKGYDIDKPRNLAKSVTVE